MSHGRTPTMASATMCGSQRRGLPLGWRHDHQITRTMTRIVSVILIRCLAHGGHTELEAAQLTVGVEASVLSSVVGEVLAIDARQVPSVESMFPRAGSVAGMLTHGLGLGEPSLKQDGAAC